MTDYLPWARALHRILTDARYYARRWEDPKAVADFIDCEMRKVPGEIMSEIGAAPDPTP